MKKLIQCLFVLLITTLAHAQNPGPWQNLIPNFGFEDVNCSQNTDDNSISLVEYWFETENTASIDFYHTCLPLTLFNPPSAGFANGFPFEGNGMAGFVPVTRFGSQWREVVSIQMTEELKKDSNYFVSFQILNGFNYGVDYGIDNIGILFTEDTIESSDIDLHPDVRSNIGLISQKKWLEVSAIYTASGGELFLNLGTFGSNFNWECEGPTIHPNGLPINLYYFIDNVVVTPSKSYLSDFEINIPNVITPNSDGVNDELTIEFSGISTAKVQIINRWGTIVHEYDPCCATWDGEVPDGTYFVSVLATTDEGKIISKQNHVTVIH